MVQTSSPDVSCEEEGGETSRQRKLHGGNFILAAQVQRVVARTEKTVVVSKK
jgi:hypothetical protein